MTNSENSKEYLYLKRRIKQIKRHFRFKQAINGVTDLQSDRLRGLILLCHAEFEDYFESVAIKLLNEAESAWDKSNVANCNLSSLFISSEKCKKGTFKTKAKQIIVTYKEAVAMNHGIKEHNLKKLFEPLGYTLDDLDPTFISTLESFASLRGAAAHSSAQRTQQPLDFITEKNRIENIVIGISDFEKMFGIK